MSKYKPGLDDDRLVGQALRALAEETADAEAPPAMEARLRAAFRRAPEDTAPAAPRIRSAWKWVAVLGTAAGLAWLALAARRVPLPSPAVETVRSAERPSPVSAAPAPAARPAERTHVGAERVVAPPVVRIAETRPRRIGSVRRPQPVVEHFEPLFPGDVLADLDAVHVVRVSVPRSALATLGWPARPGLGGRDPVELDAMVGPDGMARAVRFISR